MYHELRKRGTRICEPLQGCDPLPGAIVTPGRRVQPTFPAGTLLPTACRLREYIFVFFNVSRPARRKMAKIFAGGRGSRSVFTRVVRFLRVAFEPNHP